MAETERRERDLELNRHELAKRSIEANQTTDAGK